METGGCATDSEVLIRNTVFVAIRNNVLGYSSVLAGEEQIGCTCRQCSPWLGVDVVFCPEGLSSQERPRLIHTLRKILPLETPAKAIVEHQISEMKEAKAVRAHTADSESPMNWKASFEGL